MAVGWREDGGKRCCANGGRIAGYDCEGGGADDCKGGERMAVGDVVPMAVRSREMIVRVAEQMIVRVARGWR
jgi:hypothetical protein